MSDETTKSPYCLKKAIRFYMSNLLNSSFHRNIAVFTKIRDMLANACGSAIEWANASFMPQDIHLRERPAELRIHVKQDANRRIPPGRNPGSGGAW